MNSNLQDLKKKYKEKNLITFGLTIKQTLKGNVWKKDLILPKGWINFKLDNELNKNHNALGMLTGEVNGIFVVDIDNVEEWNTLLKDTKNKEPKTVKVISGSGGLHYYFKYTEDLKIITSKDHAIKFNDKALSIDVKTNGGFIIIPPSKYYNENLKKEVEYKWTNSIFETELKELPKWLLQLFIDKQNSKPVEKIITNKEQKEEDTEDKIQNLEDDIILDFTIDDIEEFVNMLSEDRCNNYNDWLNVGICLFNVNKNYLLLWLKWSKKSDKYEEGSCEKKWKSFKRSKDGLKIGSLLMWAKNDDQNKYDTLIKKKKMSDIIVSKFPNNKLVLGKTIMVNDKCNYTQLNNKECLIKGKLHEDMPNSMYVEMLDRFITIKCRHDECFGKTYPCQHVLMNKNEVNIAFNGDITININNNEELADFQKIDIYEDEQLNEIVFNSLNGKPYSLAKIIYYFNKDNFMYGEDKNWYVYKNNVWKNLNGENALLRDRIKPCSMELYIELLKYYKENDSSKIKSIKHIINSFDDTGQKENIMKELMEIYSVSNNPNRDFTKKLDLNKYLIGFNNGVFDLKTFQFRSGRHDDYISMNVNYDYQGTHSEKYNELLSFLEDIQPNKEERDYMLTYLSIGLVGNFLELFTILTGCGRNGKSKFIELIGVTFGDYFGAVQSQMFTRQRPDANSPDPGLLSLARKKIVIASEPEKNNKLNSGFIKFITGRDTTTLRQCHQNEMVKFTANFITFLICNDIPDCDEIDVAFSKRLRCINFPTEFVVNPTKENQKKINTNINENFDYWKMDFMLVLVDYYKKYKETKDLPLTGNILKWTNRYKEDTDLYLNYLNENTKESTAHTKTTELYENFKMWFKTNNPNSKIPNNREFLSNIRKHKVIDTVKIKGIACYGVKNIKLIDEQSDDEE